MPEDISEELAPKFFEDTVNKLWVNKSLEKNGGWTPKDPGQGLKMEVVIFGPIREIPDYHAMYSPGQHTFLVRDKGGYHVHWRAEGLYTATDGRRYDRCNHIQFYRDKEQEIIHIPDSMARELADEGLFTPLSWDNPTSDEARGTAPSKLPVPTEQPTVVTEVPY